MGVIGFSPKSSFVEYLLNLSDLNEMTVTLKFDQQDPVNKDKPTDQEKYNTIFK